MEIWAIERRGAQLEIQNVVNEMGHPDKGGTHSPSVARAGHASLPSSLPKYTFAVHLGTLKHRSNWRRPHPLQTT